MNKIKDESVILVVDDDVANLSVAQKLLGGDYRIAAANSGKTAFAYLEKKRPDLVLLDINMPEMDGFEVFEKMKAQDKLATIPVIFLTAENNSETETKCFKSGAIDFVGKPFIPDVLISRVKRTLELEAYHTKLEMMVEEQAQIILNRTRKISDMQEKVITGMANLIESRDGSTGKHVKNTQKYVDLLAKELYCRHMYSDVLTEEYIANLHKAAPLHDVGKIKIPDKILQKPGKLTTEEFLQMQKHTEYSHNILMEIMGDIEEEDYVKLAMEVALNHYERWDGSGYPNGLRGEQIPVGARIMSIADVFDALYEERCYKPAIRPLEKVISIIEAGAGSQFDPEMAKVFSELVEKLDNIVCEEDK